jgi:hypothetical protein
MVPLPYGARAATSLTSMALAASLHGFGGIHYDIALPGRLLFSAPSAALALNAIRIAAQTITSFIAPSLSMSALAHFADSSRTSSEVREVP